VGGAVPEPVPTPLVGTGQAMAVLLLYCATLGAIAAVLLHRRDLT
jgi:hypothetical protein